MTAANAGALRLFCAQHVIEEIAQHSYEWTVEAGVPHATFIQVWQRDYLPLLRLVPDAAALEAMLTAGERERVAALTDRDDVPSVVLALALGAYFLSEDGRALRAVYGTPIDLAEHRKWVDILKAGGDAGELERTLITATATGMGLGTGLYLAARWIVRATSPWVLLPMAASLGYVMAQAPPEVRARVGAGLRMAAAGYLVIAARYREASQALADVAAPQPAWDDVIVTAGRSQALARACLRALARSGPSNLSAEQLADRLPPLGVGQSEGRVRQALRGYACFVPVGPGRWQVGRPVELPMTCIDSTAVGEHDAQGQLRLDAPPGL